MIALNIKHYFILIKYMRDKIRYLIMRNVAVLIKSVFNKNYNHYYYETFSKICLCK